MHEVGTTDSRPLRIRVIDNHEIFRRGLVSVLKDDPSLDVVLDESSGEQVAPMDCEVAIVAWESLDGLALACPTIVLAPGRGRRSVPEGTKIQVAAILPRNGLTREKVIGAVHAAAAGLQVGMGDEGALPDALLDERRLDVLRLLAQGADTRTIARKLRYSERTVKTLIHDVELTLGAQTRAQAVAEGLRLGLI